MTALKIMVKKSEVFSLGSCNKTKNSFDIFCMISLSTYLYLSVWHDTFVNSSRQIIQRYTMWTIAIGYLVMNKKMLHDYNLEPRTTINNFRTKSSLTATGSLHFAQKTKISSVIRSWYTLWETFLTMRSKGNDEFSCIPLPNVQYKQRASQNHWE